MEHSNDIEESGVRDLHKLYKLIVAAPKDDCVFGKLELMANVLIAVLAVF